MRAIAAQKVDGEAQVDGDEGGASADNGADGTSASCSTSGTMPNPNNRSAPRAARLVLLLTTSLAAAVSMITLSTALITLLTGALVASALALGTRWGHSDPPLVAASPRPGQGS